MPTNLVLCARNALDAATLTATPPLVATLPPRHLQIPARALVGRTTSTADQLIPFTWGGQGWYMTFLTLNRHNLEAGATWRVQLFSDAAWTNLIYDTRVSGTDIPAFDYLSLGQLDWGVTPLGSSVFDGFLGQQYSLVYIPRVLALSGIVTISNSGNSAGYMEASRLFGGDAIEFSWNPENADFGWDEDTAQSRTDGGSLRSDGKVAFRTLDLKLTLKDEIQRAQLAEVLRYAGLRKDMFLSLYPGQGGRLERDHTGIYKLSGKLPKLSLAAGAFNQKTQLSFEEV